MSEEKSMLRCCNDVREWHAGMNEKYYIQRKLGTTHHPSNTIFYCKSKGDGSTMSLFYSPKDVKEPVGVERTMNKTKYEDIQQSQRTKASLPTAQRSQYSQMKTGMTSKQAH